MAQTVKQPTPQPQSTSKVGVASLVLAIIGIVLVLVPVVGLALGVAAIITAIVARKNTEKWESLPLVGLILGSIVTLVNIVIIVIAAAAISLTGSLFEQYASKSSDRANLVTQVQQEKKVFAKGETMLAGPYAVKVVKSPAPYVPTEAERSDFGRVRSDVESYVKMTINIHAPADRAQYDNVDGSSWAKGLEDMRYDRWRPVYVDKVSDGPMGGTEMQRLMERSDGFDFEYIYAVPAKITDDVLVLNVTISTELLPLVGSEGAPRETLVYELKP